MMSILAAGTPGKVVLVVRGRSRKDTEQYPGNPKTIQKAPMPSSHP